MKLYTIPMKFYTILVTGSRDWHDESIITAVLKHVEQDVRNQFPEQQVLFKLIEGGARGADTFARYAAFELGWETLTMPANWSAHGKAAGMIRNQEMVNLKPDVCLAFPGSSSKGTWDCVNRCKAAGIPVVVTKE